MPEHPRPNLRTLTGHFSAHQVIMPSPCVKTMMVRMDGAAQVHETNFSDEIPNGISSRARVLYRHGCQRTLRSGFVTVSHRMVGDLPALVPVSGAGPGAAEWLEGVSRL
jgi:hypothetical protein